MSYVLFIDDERDPPQNGNQWVVARSSDEAISIVKKLGMPDFISFDHDLGGDDTSMKFIDWLINMTLDLYYGGYAREGIPFIKDFTVHSQNPVGAKNIEGKLNRIIQFLRS